MTGKWYILNRLCNTKHLHFVHYTFTVICMLKYFDNQLALLEIIFLHISLSVSVLSIDI